MLSDADMTAGTARLVNGKLTPPDVRRTVSSLRLLLGPLESKYIPNLKTLIEGLDDTSDDELKAAQMAACLLRLIGEDFDVDTLDTELRSNANDQRRIFQIFALSLLIEIPEELMDELTHGRYSGMYETSSHEIVTIV